MTKTASLRALARALIINRDEGGPSLDPGSDEVLEAAFALTQTLPRDERIGCRILFRAVRWLPFFLGPRRGRLDRISREHARATLERARLSRWRLLRYCFFCAKSLLTMAYFSRPAAWPAIGYDGPYLGRVYVARTWPLPLASGPV